MAPRILCVGALTLDTIFRLEQLPGGAGKFLPLEAVEVAEGMAAAQAASIARLGGEALLWASRGDDGNGARLVEQISGEGVDCSHVQTVKGARSAFSTIFMDVRGERMIVPQYDGALMAPPDGLPDIEFSGLGAVMVDVRWPDAAEMALSEARRVGVPGILDLDVAAIPVLQRLAPVASHIVASEPAARALTGKDNAEAAVEALASRFSGFVAVTSGEKGVRWIEANRGESGYVPAVPVTAIDTLAAGDVFHAAFAVGLAEGMGIAEIVRFAARAAAIKCTRFGGRLGCPTRAEMDAVPDN